MKTTALPAFRCLFAFVLTALMSGETFATIYYVKPTGNDSNAGTSWATAYQTLQKAITTAVNNDEIWVAAGTYLPSATHGGSTDRYKTFFINENLKIYGGFNGTETLLSQRNWTTNVTILSGDLGTAGTFSDNAFHVVWFENRTSAAQLDGFTIEKGNSDQATSHPTNGGGIFNEGVGSGNSSNPTIANCIISGCFASNRGGGMYNASVSGTTNPTLTNCTFISNTAGNYGGGLFNNGTGGSTSSPTLTNCSFLGNKTNALSGGAVFNHGFQGNSSPVYTNCIFLGNTANTDGGAVLNDGGGGTSNANYINCSFSGNSAVGNGGAMYNIGANGSPTLTNCILWGDGAGNGNSEINSSGANPTVTYSIVQGGWVGTGNFDVNPLFVTQPPIGLGTAGNLRLQACSPPMDAGSDAANPSTTDADGNPRKFEAIGGGNLIDRGAYEYQFLLSGNARRYVNVATANTVANGANWACACKTMQQSIDVADANNEIWVVGGTYLPSVPHGGSTDRHKTIFLYKDLKMYGGFTGSETLLSQRNWTANVTILSGDLGTVGSNADNAYHVLWIDHRSSATELDGFLIEKGNANGAANIEKIGAGIYNDGTGAGNSSNPVIRNCSFTANASKGGSAIYNDGEGGTSSPSLTDCSIYGNTSTGGPVVFNDGYNGGVSSPAFVNCGFSGNFSAAAGAAIGNFGNNGTSNPSILNCTFSNNSTFFGGPAVFNQADNGGTCSPIISNCTFNNNSSSNFGGAIDNRSYTGSTCNPAISNCTFTNNTTSFYGGAMYNLSWASTTHPAITGCTFTGNTANKGGAAYNVGLDAGTTSPVFLNCSFSGNSVSLDGGALYNLTDTVLEYTGLCNPDLVNCTFLGNKANGNGGAVVNNSIISACNADFTNCTFSGNLAIGDGGAMYNTGTNGVRTLTNCIIWNNSSAISNAGTSPYVTYSIVQGGYSGTGNRDVNPLFVNQPPVGLGTSGDLHLQACSPALDFGNDGANTSTTDRDGNPRKFDAITGSTLIDLGAYEYQTMVATSSTLKYVNAAAPYANAHGASWACACKTLQDGMDLSGSGDEIWVAAGTYLPSATHGGSTDRYKTFFLNKNLKIYGGFNATETLLSQRNWVTNVTILSGDLGTVGDFNDNAFHVVWFENRSSVTQLDGFTIEKGNSDQTTSHPTNGGGIFNETTANGNSSNPTIANCIIKDCYATNRGGGMYNQSAAGTTGTTNPTLLNCTFLSNTAGNYGGGLFNNGTGGSVSSPAVTNCIFLGNKTNALSGGAVFNHGFQGNSSPVFTNCVFLGNTANTDGGAVINDGGGGTSNASYINCSFSGNSAVGNAGAMYNIGLGCIPTLTNCIIWGNNSAVGNVSNANPTVTYSIVQGGYAGTGNLNVNPLFVSQPPIGLGTAGDLSLQPCSPAADAGNDAANITTTDAAGNARKFDAIPGGGMIDMGAYEYQLDFDVDNDGYTVCGGVDCNDNNAAIHPGAPEICNSLDDDCSGAPESATTTWIGLGDDVNWSSGGNWSDGFAPLPCQDVVIPAAGNVTVPAGFTAVGKTLDVATGGVLTTQATGQVDIHN